MGANTNIEWAHHTFNPWRGCTKDSEGCRNCYAEKLSFRNPGTLGVWGPKGKRPIAAESYWAQPLLWNKIAKESGEKHRVFCASLADVFEGPETMPAEYVELIDAARVRLWSLIEETPNLIWLLLTKRPHNVLKMVPKSWAHGCPRNVWVGTSVEDQKTANKRIPELEKIPAAKLFLSVEPLIGLVSLAAIDRGRFVRNCLTGEMTSIQSDESLTGFLSPRIDWVIVGGESGRNARPMDPNWVRTIRDQCQSAGVPFFFKQWGEWLPWDHFQYTDIEDDFETSRYPATVRNGDDWSEVQCLDWESNEFDVMGRVGKKRAGNILDGRTWQEVPQ